MSIERVVKIKSLNQQGVFPEELEPVEVTSSKPKEVEPEFADLVGQISLQTLEKADKRNASISNKKDKNHSRERDQRPQQGPGNRQQDMGGRQAGNNQQGNQQSNRPQRPQGGQGNNQGQPNRGNQGRPQRRQGPRPNQGPPKKEN